VPVALGLLLACTAAYAAHVSVGLGGGNGDVAADRWFVDAIIGASSVLCLWRSRVPEDRSTI
jgi:hypothetical protein